MLIEILNIEHFNKIMQNTDKLIIINFYSNFVKECRVLEFKLEDLSKKYENIKFLSVNGCEHNLITESYQIKSYPTTVFYKDGMKFCNNIIGNNIDKIEEKIIL